MAPAAYRIRAISPADRTPLTRFYSALSADSVEARFHGALPTIPARTARFFCGPDHEHREGLVAETVDSAGAREIIGHVCIEPITSDLAEIAIAVADAWQHHGVGRAMLAEAIDWAQTHDVGRLLASMRWSNAAMLELLRSTGQGMTFGDSDGGITDVILDVGAATPHAA
jgi:acetyltransferase